MQFVIYSDKLLNDQKKLSKFFTDFSYVHTDISNKSDLLMWVRNFFEFRDGNKKKNRYGKILYELLKGSRLFIRKKHYKEVCGPAALPVTFKKNLEITWENSDWYIVENKIKDNLPPFEDIEGLVAQLDKDELAGVIYHYFDWDIQIDNEVKDEEEFSLAEAWLELNNGNPYFKI